MQKIYTILFAGTLLLLAGKSQAQATDIFVKIVDNTGATINGGSTDKGHTNELPAVSFGQENPGCALSTGGAGGASCGGTLGHFIFNMGPNQSIPNLDKALFGGTV